jgi:hypothetical protein
MWFRAKTRAAEWSKKSGVPFDEIFSISPQDIHIPEICPVLGIPIVSSVGDASHNSPSLDRIDSSKGYVIGNVQVISQRANSLKSDATVEELELVVAHLRKALIGKQHGR